MADITLVVLVTLLLGLQVLAVLILSAVCLHADRIEQLLRQHLNVPPA